MEGYAVIAEPLTRLTKKNVDFSWREEQVDEFQTLRNVLTRPPVLGMFNHTASATELHTDASSVGLGAVLLQFKGTGESLQLIYCVSKRTSEAELKYHSSKLELMCVV